MLVGRRFGKIRQFRFARLNFSKILAGEKFKKRKNFDIIEL
jgi:hypothetical protein